MRYLRPAIIALLALGALAAMLAALNTLPGESAFPGVNGKIVFYRNAEIYVMNADGTGQTNLTNDPATDYAPAWSPDGTKIAFYSDRDGNLDVYVMNAD